MSKLTVVVPAFNEEDFIEGCLDRLVDQTRPIDEIIVVDNGSTDATPQIVDRYVDAHPTVTRLVEHTPGVMAARRAGFDAATSDIIAKTDADSRVAPDWAERIVAFFDSDAGGTDHAALTGPVLTWDGPFYEFQRKLQTKTLGPLGDGGEIKSVHGPNYALRRTVWLRVREKLQTTDDVWEDLDLGLTLSETEHRIYFDPKVAADASCRQLRHSPPWANRSYITGGLRTARGQEQRCRDQDDAYRPSDPIRHVHRDVGALPSVGSHQEELATPSPVPPTRTRAPTRHQRSCGAGGTGRTVVTRRLAFAQPDRSGTPCRIANGTGCPTDM